MLQDGYFLCAWGSVLQRPHSCCDVWPLGAKKCVSQWALQLPENHDKPNNSREGVE